MRRPPALYEGSRIALLAPSSAVSEEMRNIAVDSVFALGMKPVLFPTAFGRHGYFSGTDQERADDINQAFIDPSIEGIFCIRGGYGAARILPLLKYSSFHTNPKVFLGYSDITALHTAINQRCELATLHAPMPGGGYRNADIETRSILCSHLNAKTQTQRTTHTNLIILSPGDAEGSLCGGNLSVLVSCLGSPYEIDTLGKILFLEDVKESLYKTDRNLTALALAGKFRDCSGVLLGQFSDLQPDDLNTTESHTLLEIIREILLPERKPVFINFPAGHCRPNYALPMGLPVRLNEKEKALDILQPLTMS